MTSSHYDIWTATAFSKDPSRARRARGCFATGSRNPAASRSNSKPNRDPGVRTEREIEHRNRGHLSVARRRPHSAGSAYAVDDCSAARRIWCGSGPLTLQARFGHEHRPATLVRRRRLVGSDKRPTQTTARTWRYGVARTDTSDFSGPRHRHHCRDMWIHRVSGCAEEQATRTRVLGFFCGWMAGAILRGRRRSLNALGAVARCADIRPRRAGIRRGAGHFAVHALTLAASHVRRGVWPPGRHREMGQRL
jgi:hypothetical protein